MRMTSVVAEDVVLAHGSVIALDRSSFSIPDGGVVALIGPNGSGKSTLLSAIAGLIDPVAGTLDVRPINGRRRRIAYVLQTIKVNDALPITVREVVTMGRYGTAGPYGRLTSADRAAVSDAIARTGIADLASRHLHELSAGQRQRVFVAQGLAQEHDLLLLDEPLTGLDLPAAQAIDDVIHDELTRGCTVVVATHDLTEAQVADHVLLLSGRVVASGAPAEALTVDNLQAAYGPTLLHVDGDQLFVDDPAHRPIAGRHLHRERSIHTESAPTDLHSP